MWLVRMVFTWRWKPVHSNSRAAWGWGAVQRCSFAIGSAGGGPEACNPLLGKVLRGYKLLGGFAFHLTSKQPPASCF